MKNIVFILSLVWLVASASYAFGESSSHHGDEDHEHAVDEGQNEEHENEEGEHGHEDDHGHEEDEHGHEDEEEGVTSLTSAMAKEVGIETSIVGEQTLNQTVVSYGAVSTGTEKLSHVKARFPGLVRSVKSNIGDQVKRGELLAKIESNDSLRTYSLTAPISGTVIQRHANTGEFADDQVLFSIANFDTLWAEFRVYPSQVSLVKIGQSVRFKSGERTISAVIRHIVPVVDKPYQIARVEFDNKEVEMGPGVLVEGNIEIGEFQVALAVNVEAIQSLGGQDGAFVNTGEEYRFVPLKLGRRDDHYVEVLEGLVPGQKVVSKNSYLIKADIEKSEAEHEH